MKLYHTGGGESGIIYVILGGVTFTINLYKAGQEYTEALAEQILSDYPHVASANQPMKTKLAQPELRKGGVK